MAIEVLKYPDYYAHEFAGAHPNNYTAGRGGNEIDRIVIHVTQGSFESAYNWCQNPNAGVSWHYLLKNTGYAAQQLSEAHTGYHAANWEFNQKSVGIEHAGFISDPNMWTDEVYTASAKIAAGVILRSTLIPEDSFDYHLWGHDNVPGSNHGDPGQYFDWGRYMELIAGFLSESNTVTSGKDKSVTGGGGSTKTTDKTGSRRGVWRGSRWEWCQNNAAPTPAILTYKGDDTWRVERIDSGKA